ncbi:hypothetical protein M6B38_177350 [Iris pallida]|uniref:Uncharacterized protein n=1 Tax=Iris pallida TaxID=29817 RepID=A0AAX6EQ60_IRIPA|nr:hypothetical protein M6B38_177350 [Iris pallida]
MMAVSVLDSVKLPDRALQLLQACFVLLESLGKRKRPPVERIRVFHFHGPSSPLLLLWPRSRSLGQACP